MLLVLHISVFTFCLSPKILVSTEFQVRSLIFRIKVDQEKNYYPMEGYFPSSGRRGPSIQNFVIKSIFRS